MDLYRIDCGWAAHKMASLNKNFWATTDRAASNELVIALVGHADSRTTAVANELAGLLRTSGGNKLSLVVEIIEVRSAIQHWAVRNGESAPEGLSDVLVLQGGDRYEFLRAKMCSAEIRTGVSDDAAVARVMLGKIREARDRLHKPLLVTRGVEALKHQLHALILNSVRTQAEIELLRLVYGDAFVSLGVICGEREHFRRTEAIDRENNHIDTQASMDRYSSENERYSQQWADAFDSSDYIIENTSHPESSGKSPNLASHTANYLSKFVKALITSRSS